MTRRKGYHHGNLRAGLVAAGVELVREGGGAALTTRACAQRNGVSSSAVFRHFRDRRALVEAVAEEGFAMLARRTASADPGLVRQDHLRAIGGAYLRFAIDEPNLFRLMYSSETLDAGETGLEVTPDPLLVQVAFAAGAGGDPGDARTLLAWSIVHGLAMLTLDKQLDGLVPSDPHERAERLDAILKCALPLFAAPDGVDRKE
ncbi:MAG: TetR/AcrR family transcriptional regulator [Phenylobacterium sp.]